MATINNSNEARSIIGAALGGKGNGNRQQSGDRPQAEFFINIGVTVPMPDENGNMVDTFLSLPYGLPLDTMSELVIRGNNEVWNNQAAARNELLKALVKMGGELEAGSGQELPKLQVQLYRRKEQTEHTASTSAVSAILNALSS
ncbi:TPA: hypothetical protein MCM04_005067 [Klebsiella pneumoniae]|nr:hypothetical protein [Klebsiella pneumoniae]